ncbi:MAG: cation diffusion facilitator family transporter [Actinomycetota bacterium]
MARALVSEERRRAERVALGSLGAALFLVAAKTVAGLASGSLAVLSEAAHSALDSAATLMAFVAVRIGSRPPDADHPYGHGKAESIFSLLEVAGLLTLSGFILWEAVDRLRFGGEEVDATWYAFGVIVLSIVVDFSRSRILSRAGRELRSPALQADALHFAADLLTSSAVLLGLVLVRAGYPVADAVAGLAVGGLVAFMSIRLGRRSVDALMDRAPADAVERIRLAAESVEGVSEVRRVRIRHVGGQPHADVVVGVSRRAALETAHEVTEKLESAVRRVEPGADVVVHVEPLADESLVAEQVMSIAARDPSVSQVHNVHVVQRPDGLHITLHAKFPDTMGLEEAHRISERLEREIASEVGAVARVDTHLEPLEDLSTAGADVTARRAGLVDWATKLANSQPEVADCHEVLVTEADGSLSIVMHCTATSGLTVADVHRASTEIENRIHERWSEVGRVTVHFEPPGGTPARQR